MSTMHNAGPSSPAANLHPWSKDPLLTKARLYVEEMQVQTVDDWRFALWSTLVLELLCRATLGNVSATLLADPKSSTNLLFANGITPKVSKFVPKSIDISTAIALLSDVIPDFPADLIGFAQVHMGRRNEELHSGGSPLDQMASSSWLPNFYRFCKVMLLSMGESLATFFGTEEAAAAEAMIAASLDESAKSVQKSIAGYRTVWESKDPNDQKRLSKEADTWAIKQIGHRVTCPACQSRALVTGAAMAPPIRKIDGDEITEVHQYMPSKFECVACGLKISGLPQLSACGLGNSYKATAVYDAAEYYKPEEDPYEGYEEDYND